jgi:alcohol dehydrogenase (cytochrome c)
MPAAVKWPLVALLFGALSFPLHAQITSQRLAAAASEPQNWLTYSGSYSGGRYSPLDRITPQNVRNLKLQWAYQSPVAGNWQTSPLVVDGVMYLTQRLNDVVALDAVTGRAFWIYRYTPAADRIVCCGANNRGLAILGDTLFMGTLDANLIAIDAKTGRQVWKTEVAKTREGYSITLAPLVVKDKVIVGVGGGEYGIRGFIAAYDAGTGKEAWRFYTIPGPGEKGHETWEACPAKPESFCDPEAWKHGGGSIWVTGSSARSGPATTCIPTRWSRSTPTRARSGGTTSSRRTTSTTTTPCRFRCTSTIGPTREPTSSRGQTETATSISSIARQDGSCWGVRSSK